MPLGTANDLLSTPQLVAREFFVDAGSLKLPGRPYQLTVPSTEAVPRREFAQRGQSGVRRLEGVRIVDFSWVLTGPICTRSLAALGAEVIKVESATRADLSQRNLAWEELNMGKRSITLNLKESRARELVRQLIARSDVVVENFSTGVMERLGLDYDSLREVNPRIIMASSSAFGRTGPDRELVAYGTLVQCLTGWAALSAHPGYPPRSSGGVWTDPLTAGIETFLVLAAIWRQRESGVGCFIDLSMAETTIAALPEPVLAWSGAREAVQPRGNRHPVFAPQGCYPALGDDRWIALSIQSDAEWAELWRLMHRPGIAQDPRFSSQAGRQKHHDVLDELISTWSMERAADETAELLQLHGIAAAATIEPADILHDVQLCARSFISQLERLDGSSVLSVPGAPWLIDGQRPSPTRRPPRLGEDNDYVFKSVLGLSDADYSRSIDDRVIY
jgi:benzylsuccinate CoA-transferase BbsF subunit